MSPEDREHEDMKTLLRENQRLLVENNTLLKELKRANVLSFVFRVVWLLIIIGLVLGAYVFVVGPYIEQFTGSFEELRSGLDRVPSFESLRNGAAAGEGASSGN